LRSTRALRVEGDYHNVVFVGYDEKFLSTPSGWRATCCLLPMRTSTIFLSTPSGWRATLAVSHGRRCWIISIHALRVEGDQIRCVATLSKPYFYPRPPGGGRRAGPLYHAARRVDFYPRPPGGGRQIALIAPQICRLFLSTPSGWRATRDLSLRCRSQKDFYPRPPGGGRLPLQALK